MKGTCHRFTQAYMVIQTNLSKKNQNESIERIQDALPSSRLRC